MTIDDLAEEVDAVALDSLLPVLSEFLHRTPTQIVESDLWKEILSSSQSNYDDGIRYSVLLAAELENE